MSRTIQKKAITHQHKTEKASCIHAVMMLRQSVWTTVYRQ